MSTWKEIPTSWESQFWTPPAGRETEAQRGKWQGQDRKRGSLSPEPFLPTLLLPWLVNQQQTSSEGQAHTHQHTGSGVPPCSSATARHIHQAFPMHCPGLSHPPGLNTYSDISLRNRRYWKTSLYFTSSHRACCLVYGTWKIKIAFCLLRVVYYFETGL